MSILTLQAKRTPTAQQAAVLKDAMLCATKVYNGLLYQLREQDRLAFEQTGPWPKTTLSDSRLNVLLKSCPRRRAMHSDVACQVFRTLHADYASFFALKRNGRADAHAPRFKRKDTLSPRTFPRCNRDKACAFVRKKRGKVSLELRFGLNRLDGVRSLRLRMFLPPHRHLPFERIRQVEVLYDTNVGFTAHLSFETDAIPSEGTNTVAVDLGEKHRMACHFSDGEELLVRGGQLRAIRRYWQKVRSKVKPPSTQNRRMSRRYRQIARKESRQVEHALHMVSKRFVETCAQKGVSCILLGDLTGIRETIDYGSHANQRLHAWPFAKLTDFIRYKASLVGITVETLDESSTSRTCSACGHRKTTPVKGRRFVCLECGCVLHRDLNGARNIYHRAVNVSPDDGSRGALAVPAVVSWLLSWHTVCEPASSVSIASAVA